MRMDLRSRGRPCLAAGLKTPRSGVEGLLEQEARDRRVRANGPTRAEATVLGRALDSEDSDYRHLSDAVTVIYDADALAATFGLSVEDFADPDGYGDGGGRTVGWAVLRTLVRVALMRNDAQLARDLLAYTNSARRERAELVQERRLECPWLEAALDLKVEYADEIAEGLESLCPGMIEIRRHEDARRLPRETDDLLQSILTRHGKFNRKLQAGEIDADIRAFAKRLGLFELGAAGGGERFLAPLRCRIRIDKRAGCLVARGASTTASDEHSE